MRKVLRRTSLNCKGAEPFLLSLGFKLISRSYGVSNTSGALPSCC